MAISYVGSLGGSGGGSDTNLSLTSCEVTGTEIMILYWCEFDNQSNTVSVLNYDDGAGGGSQAFTQLGTYQDTTADGIGRFSMWYLAGATTGSGRRILGTQSGSSPHQQMAVFYNGVAQTSPFTTPTQGVDTATPLADTDTSDRNGSWHIAGVGTISGPNISISSGGVIREVRPVPGVVYGNILGDSDAAFNSASSNTINWAWTAATSMAYISAMMRPPAAPAAAGNSGTGLLSLLGVGN